MDELGKVKAELLQVTNHLEQLSKSTASSQEATSALEYLRAAYMELVFLSETNSPIIAVAK